MNIHGFGKDYTCSLQYRLLLQSFYINYSVFSRTLMTFCIYITMHFTIAIFFTVKVVLVFHSASFPYFHVSHFPPLLFGAEFSCPVFSTLVIWCRIFMSRIFHPCHLASFGATFSCLAFSRSAFSASPYKHFNSTGLVRVQSVCLSELRQKGTGVTLIMPHGV